jgi:hypothetical protein
LYGTIVKQTPEGSHNIIRAYIVGVEDEREYSPEEENQD